MPKNPAAILLFRHAEKPADEADHHLSPRGRARAEALATLLGDAASLKPDAIFATKTEKDGGGVRTQETVEPLARRLGVDVRTPVKKGDVDGCARAILDDDALAGKVVAVCWDHKNIPALAATLGLGDRAPAKWDKDTFDRFWLLSFAGNAPVRLRELVQPIVFPNPETEDVLEDPPGPFGRFVRAPAAGRSELDALHESFGVGGDANTLESTAVGEPSEAAPGDLELSSEADIRRALDALDADPEPIVRRARLAFDPDIDEVELREHLTNALKAVSAPAAAVAARNAEMVLERAAVALPPEFTFDGYDPNGIPIDPSSTKFEQWGDALGWIINSGRWVLGYPPGPRRAFHWHDDPKYPSRFLYHLDTVPNGDTSIALFSDFGCGLYHSRYIAKQLRADKHRYAIHLGDVYYAGREAEFAAYFRRELDPLLGSTRLFTMMGNHEMFSTGAPFFRYLDDRRAHAGRLQQQEGSYFCLRGDKVQIIGIDTDYFGASRYQQTPLKRWLTYHLEVGRAKKLTNILLSGDEPYEYGSSHTTALLEDLREVLVTRHLVDLMFWGNTHYCALFEPSAALPFIGSCIGHGGFPYGRQAEGKASPARVAFLESGARFPAWTGIRQDRGNNGYCILTLRADGHLSLRYVDWMRRDRCLVDIARSSDGRLVLGTPWVA